RETEAIGSWLYRVAHRTALQAGMDMARRSVRERQSGKPVQTHTSSETALRELQTVLDEEVQRLPEKYRAPFLLCCLEGKTRTEAAQELGWKEGTVAGRLAEARKRRQQRLARRGVALTVALTVLALAPAVEGAPATALLDRTLVAALQFAAGARAGEAIPPSVASLVQGAPRTMLTTKAKMATAVLFLLGLLTASVLAHRVLAAREAPSPAAAVAGENQLDGPDAAADDKDRPADAGEPVELRGVVLDPEGKPLAGAGLYLAGNPWNEKNKAKPGLRATSDAEGRFRFPASRAELGEGTKVIAT